jgi:hypothetical protein
LAQHVKDRGARPEQHAVAERRQITRHLGACDTAQPKVKRPPRGQLPTP